MVPYHLLRDTSCFIGFCQDAYTHGLYCGVIDALEISFETSEQRLIGDAAKNQAASNPQNTVFDAKRFLLPFISAIAVSSAQNAFIFAAQNAFISAVQNAFISSAQI
ncbi:ATPase with role in protein import into the ER [Trifolium repens]|nr:ATPase with role in protein import into the ER [Trifolium repens]